MNDQSWTILVIDSEADSRRLISDTLRTAGFSVLEAHDGTTALHAAREHAPNLILLELGLTDTDPERLLRTLSKKHPQADILVLTRQHHLPAHLVRTGVDDTLTKPIDPDELLDKVRLLQIRSRFLREFKFVGKNEKIIQVMETVLQVAPTQILILITGESGTGKDVIAQAIHEHSRRRSGPFIAVNCGAIAEGVLESELFGHERGAFTGAHGRRKGYFELADGGTLFLDEIGEMPLSTQVKLLRVLENQRFMRVGGADAVAVDVRVIAATNKDLDEAVQTGNFRRDLYFRLKAVNIRIPPLRERKDDIPRLIAHFAEEAVARHHVPFAGFTDDAMAWIMEYAWPGNIRELRNTLESLIVTMDGRRVGVDDLPYEIARAPMADRALPVVLNRSREELERELIYKALLAIRTDITDLRVELRTLLQGYPVLSPPHRVEVVPMPIPSVPSHASSVEMPHNAPGTIDDMERLMIQQALEQYGGHREKTAKHLGIGERTLYRKLEKYGLLHSRTSSTGTVTEDADQIEQHDV